MEVFVLNEMKTFSKEKMKKVKLFDTKNFSMRKEGEKGTRGTHMKHVSQNHWN